MPLRGHATAFRGCAVQCLDAIPLSKRARNCTLPPLAMICEEESGNAEWWWNVLVDGATRCIGNLSC